MIAHMPLTPLKRTQFINEMPNLKEVDVFPEVYPEKKLITVNSIRLGEVGVWS